MTERELTSLIIKSAIDVHKELGPGLLESASFVTSVVEKK